MIHKLRCWFYDPNRYYYFTGANNIHTDAARDELEEAGVIYAETEVYNYKPGFDGKYTLGLGDLTIFERIRVRFILWRGGVYGRLWFAE